MNVMDYILMGASCICIALIVIIIIATDLRMTYLKATGRSADHESAQR